MSEVPMWLTKFLRGSQKAECYKMMKSPALNEDHPDTADRALYISRRIGVPPARVVTLAAEAEDEMAVLDVFRTKGDDATFRDAASDDADLLEGAGVEKISDVLKMHTQGTLEEFFNTNSLTGRASSIINTMTVWANIQKAVAHQNGQAAAKP